ncbi:hypothetical protein BGW38_007742 [Lunasporangiospora selenospora]|uniref:FAD-binding domain-containing protein n=1 Tax=Lunasporangiospora selenospora TaxID=979761 RepID=A0A9P6KGS3_9FUNG|nr:hypothetical protein BGW38_007742 [Lunasporangiospora selenospora]
MVSATSSTKTTTLATQVDVPVLISGAGPVGLYEAYLLTKLNIPVRIIERDLTLSPLSKAIAIQPRSLEAHGKLASYTILGFGTTDVLVEELAKMGVHIDHGWEMLDTKVVESTEGSTSGEKTGTYVETTIRRSLKRNEETEFKKHLIGHLAEIEDDDDAQYETQVIRSQYLIGSDGARSTTRHKLNIPFNGRTLPHKTYMADCSFESELDLNNVISFIWGATGRSMLAFPLTNGMLRIAIDDGFFKEGEELHEVVKGLTHEKFEAAINETIYPSKFKIKECGWLTSFRINERRAEQFGYKRRIFLAGDAAHVHSPSGGQGLNMGIQDAHNLAWKIGLVIHGLAPSSLLDTYEERIPIADHVIKLSSELWHNNRRMDFAARFKRRILFIVIPIALSVMRLVGKFMEVPLLKLRYPINNLNREHETQSRPSENYQVGIRASDGVVANVMFAKGQSLPEAPFQGVCPERLHHLLAGVGSFHVLVFASDMLTKQYAPGSRSWGTPLTTAKAIATNIDIFLTRWRTKWSYKQKGLKIDQDGEMFRIHVISGTPITIKDASDPKDRVATLAQLPVGGGKIFVDESKGIHKRYGYYATGGAGGIVIVRPDSYIGYRVNGAGDEAWRDIDDYFMSILTC